MKSCVVTASFGCSPNKIWLYLTNPTLNHWNPNIADADVDLDSMKMSIKKTNGSVINVTFNELEKARKMSCNFSCGRIKGTFTAILFGSGDTSSVECTMDVSGMGLFAKPGKQLNEFFATLRKAIGE